MGVKEKKNEGGGGSGGGGGGGGGGNGGGGGDSGGKKEEEEIVLKVELHCEGCAKKLKKYIHQLKGVKDVKTDVQNEKLTVKGEVDPILVRDKVALKVKRKVDILSPKPKPPPPPADKSVSNSGGGGSNDNGGSSDRSIVVVPPPQTESGGGGTYQPMYNQNYYNQEYGVAMDNNNYNPSSYPSSYSSTPAYQHAPPSYMYDQLPQCMRPPILTSSSSHMNAPPPLPYQPPPPYMFSSDENPNTCSLM